MDVRVVAGIKPYLKRTVYVENDESIGSGKLSAIVGVQGFVLNVDVMANSDAETGIKGNEGGMK